MHVEALWEGRRLGLIAGKLCPTGQSRDSARDVGGKQPVSVGAHGEDAGVPASQRAGL